MDELQLLATIRSGAASMGRSLGCYWPAWGENEVAEANQVLHVGRAFLDAGYCVYSEAHREGGADQRFDLLVIDPAQTALVVGEFKRAYNPDQCLAMANDAQRIMGFWPLAEQWRGSSGADSVERWGLVGGTTWRPEYAAWFLSDDLRAKDPTGGSLDKLWGAVARSRPRFGAVPLLSYSIKGAINTQWFVYVLFRP